MIAPLPDMASLLEPIPAMLLEVTLKSSLVLALALVAAGLLRTRSAAVRHWLLSMSLVCAAALPFIASIAPAWRLDLPSSATAAHPPASRATETTAIATPIGRDEIAVASDDTPAALTFPDADALRVGLFALWIGGLLFNLSSVAVGLARLRRIASRAQLVCAGPWIDLLDAVSCEYGLRRPVALLQSDHPTLLVTWGFFSPKVLLPASADEWTAHRRRVVLCHELAHIRRADWTLQMAAELFRCVFWFNPLVWIVCRRLREESELACDDAVLRVGVEGPDYATHLLDLARAFSGRPHAWSPAQAMARSSGLERRITAMLNTRLNHEPLTRGVRRAIAAVVVAITIPVAGFGAAQTANATLSGTITDPSGAGVAQAAVVLTHTGTKAAQNATSDDMGRYQIANVPAGAYRLEVKKEGFVAVERNVTLSRTTTENIKLQIGTVQETITLRGGTTDTTPNVATMDGKPMPTRSDKGLAAPIKLRDVKPIYPKALADKGIQGKVLLEGEIGRDGSIASPKVVSTPHPDLGKAAADAVRQWKFAPTLLHGKPVATTVKVTIEFQAGQ